MFDSTVLGAVLDRLEVYSNGMMARPINLASLKVEARPVEFQHGKYRTKKPRVFCATQVIDVIIGRMVLVPLLEVLKTKLEVFEIAVGINACSHEWGDIVKWFVKDYDMCFANDFKGFDTDQKILVKKAVHTILIRIAKSLDWNQKSITILNSYLSDKVYPILLVGDDLLEMPNIGVSGAVGTAELNTLCLSIMFRMGYIICARHENKPINFDEDVRLIGYGDDSYTNSSVEWFNQTSFIQACAEFGVNVTPSDKAAEAGKFSSFGTEEFLHRTWRFDEEVQVWMAPLAEDSLARSLTLNNISAVLGVETQNLSALQSVNWEMAQYGREAFLRFRRALPQLIEASGLADFGQPKFHDFDEIIERCYQVTLTKREETCDIEHISKRLCQKEEK